MDFWVDIGIAAILRLLKDRRELAKWRPAMVKVAAAILNAYDTNETFQTELKHKRVKGS